MKKPRLIFTLWILAVALTGCGDSVIVDENKLIKDGDSETYEMTPGRYKLEIKASADGVKIKWIGAACSESKTVTFYEEVCEFIRKGQVRIENPSLFGNGETSSVTIKLTRLSD